MNEGRRPYQSAVRQEQARQTRTRVVTAARDLFVSAGYSRTTISTIAAAAGVSQDTVYSGFGNKPGLLKAVVDVTLAGDDEPMPFAARPEVARIEAAATAQDALVAYAPWAAGTAARIAPVVLALRAARGHADVDAMLQQMDEQRLAGVTMLASTVCSKPGASVRPAELRDQVFVLASVETYDLAVNRRGWSQPRYTRWLSQALIHAAKS